MLRHRYHGRMPRRASPSLACLLFLVAGLLLLGGPTARADEPPLGPKGPARDKRHADLELDRYEHDFGYVKQNTVNRAEFTYTNKGAAKVAGIRARGECGCNVALVSKRELAPGESGVLKVEFNTLTLGGHLRKRIHLYSSDHTRGESLIGLKIAIVKGLVVRPPGLSFGDVKLGTKPAKSFSLRWYEGVGKPFTIEEIDAPKGFEVVKTSFEDPKDPLWKGWRIELKLTRELPLGMYSAEVLVRTTDKERPRIVTALSANVCGKVWLQSRRLSFGTFTQGRKRSSSIKFRPFDKTVTFGEVSAKSRSGRLQVEVKPDPYMGDKGVWKLIATVPVGATAGSLEQEIIELHTGVPGEEVTLLKVRGRVRPRRGAGAPAAKAPAAKAPAAKARVEKARAKSAGTGADGR